MHFEWQLSLGQVVISVPIIWVVVMLMRIYTMLLRFRVEHELLMSDWALRQVPPVKLMDLPTRQGKWW